MHKWPAAQWVVIQRFHFRGYILFSMWQRPIHLHHSELLCVWHQMDHPLGLTCLCSVFPQPVAELINYFPSESIPSTHEDFAVMSNPQISHSFMSTCFQLLESTKMKLAPLYIIRGESMCVFKLCISWCPVKGYWYLKVLIHSPTWP